MNYILALIISLIYGAVKFVETKFIMKEEVNFKQILRNTILVYASCLVGEYAASAVGVTSATQLGGSASTEASGTYVFTSEPQF